MYSNEMNRASRVDNLSNFVCICFQTHTLCSMPFSHSACTSFICYLFHMPSLLSFLPRKIKCTITHTKALSVQARNPYLIPSMMLMLVTPLTPSLMRMKPTLETESMITIQPRSRTVANCSVSSLAVCRTSCRKIWMDTSLFC
jgi:hypothetical protein